MAARRRLLYYGISLVALALYAWAFSWQSTRSALPADFDAGSLAWPVGVEGATAATPDELRYLAEARPVGSTLVVESGGALRRIVLVRSLSTRLLVITLISGLFFWAIGFLVFAPRIDSGPVRDFYWCTLLYGLAVLNGGPYFHGPPVWPAALQAVVQWTCMALLPAVFLHLTLVFPRPHRLLKRFPWITAGLLLVAVLLIAWQALAYARYFAAPGPAPWRSAQAAHRAADAILVVQVALACLLLFQSARGVELAREKRQVRWLLWGFTVGVAPYVFLRTLPGLWGYRSPVGPEFDRLLELLIPISFTLAIVRHRFLDIDVIIRRSLIAAILAGLMAALYVVAGLGVGGQIARRHPAAQPFVIPVVVGLAVIVFGSLRRLVGRWVDRTFFKLRYNSARALERFQALAAEATGQRPLADALRSVLEQNLRPREIGVIVRSGGAFHFSGRPGGDLPRDPGALFDMLAGGPAGEPAAALLAAPNSTSCPEIESAKFPAVLAGAGIRLVQPLRGPGEPPPGFIWLSEKRSERRYVEEEIALLDTLAVEAGRALDHMNLVQKIADEEYRLLRLAELDRMKSEFLSRAAHDFRTPLTSIDWSSQNLLDGLAGELTAAQASYVDSMRVSARQMGRLVDNLLEITRLKESPGGLTPAPVDLAGVIDEAVRTLHPIAGARGIEFQVEVGPGAAPVAADRATLVKVAVNLLANAVRYSPPDSGVEIAAGPAAAGFQEMVVRDHGPGLAGEDLAAVFQKFHQGRPSPYSSEKGFGLGLHIVKSWVELFGGSVAARNHPQGGAEFTCRLPVYNAPGGSGAGGTGLNGGVADPPVTPQPAPGEESP